MAADALAATRAAHLKAYVAYLPHASASPEQVAEARDSDVVAPLYPSDPAPMGLTDYGLTGSGNGDLTGSILNTTVVQGVVDLNSTGIRGMDLYQSDPDGFSIQLNGVLSNVTLFGVAPYTFWAQDVVTYFPSSGLMFLISNVWNFSGGPFTSSSIYSHGPDGVAEAGLDYYYAVEQIGYRVSYPFNLTLTMTSELSGTRNEVTFAAALTSRATPSEDFSTTFDDVVFNSDGGGPLSDAHQASNFTVDGKAYNPIGLLYDLELDIAGPGSGSQVDLGTADATLALEYRTPSGSLASVPSAYNYGSDTAETATGADVAWSNQSGEGPPGIQDYGTMTTGPSVLSGLWGLGAPGGSYAVTLNEDPGNAFNFFFYNGTATFFSPIVYQREYAPNMETSTFYLMPGEYVVTTELADHTPKYTIFDLTGPLAFTIDLALNVSEGVYTPLWAFTNPEVAALSSSGMGSPADPYRMYDNQLAPFSSDFGLYNDLAFPVFPGVFLDGTTASVDLLQPPSLSANTSELQSVGPTLPTTNDLPLWFWNVSGVALLDAVNISGWFAASAYFPLSFDPFSVIFYESSDNLVAGNQFFPQGLGLLLYSGGSTFGALNIGGGNNTVWGNSFFEIESPTSCPDSSDCALLMPYGWGIGVELGESPDLVYNNLFITPTTAWLLPLNLYSGAQEEFSGDLWNITPQAASTIHYAPSFPTIALAGSIVGGSTQGGNAWWDYGLLDNWYNGADNPLKSLPYDENAITLISQLPAYPSPPYYDRTYIYPGGDLAPLASPSESVAISEHGLPPGTAWSAEISCDPPHTTGGNGSSTTVSTACCAPPHTTGGNGSSTTGDVCCAPPHTTGGNGSSTASVCCSTVHDTGGNTSSAGSGCSPTFVLAVLNSTSPTIHLGDLPVGEYNWTPILPAGYASSAGGTFVVSTRSISLSVPTTPVADSSLFTIRESGLRAKTPWEVKIEGTGPATDPFNTTLTLASSSHKINLGDGTYDLWIGGVPGYSPTFSTSVLTLTGPTTLRDAFHRTAYAVSFDETGLAAGSRWGVTVNGPVRGSGTGHLREFTTGSSLVFDLPNGSFTYQVRGLDGRACPSPMSDVQPTPPYCTNGTITVSAAPVTISLEFDPPAVPAFAAEPLSLRAADLGPIADLATVAAAPATLLVRLIERA